MESINIPAHGLGGLVRSRRIAAGLTQEELSGHAGVSVRTIRDIERGRRATPSSTSIRLLAEALEGRKPQHELVVAAAASRVKRLTATIDDGPLAAPAGKAPVHPAQLPPTVRDFTGRSDESAALLAVLSATRGGQPGPAAVAAIAGMPGIGKTALALHVAHRVASYYPDGQLFLNLRGMDSPITHQAAFYRFLRDLGSAPPPHLGSSEYAGHYQTMLAGKRMLIVLDNAYDSAHVRPFIPSAPGCGVVITSRSRLADLEGCTPVHLGTLADAEARTLLGNIAGPERVAAEPRQADDLLNACAGLPLAVRIVGARLASRPGWNLATLAERLACPGRLLAELRTGDLAVERSLRQSYDGILRIGPQGRSAQAGFVRLGQLSRDTFTLADAKSLMDGTEASAENILELLVDINLIQPSLPGRYQLHHLIRLFSQQLYRESAG